MNRKEYERFYRCTREVMRGIISKMDRINNEFYLTDENIEEMHGISDTITVLGRQFYGRDFSIAERKAFVQMYI